MAVEIISTVLVAATAQSPAAPYDLTDLATVHDELTIPTLDTSKDSFLSRAITQSSTAIASYCNRVFTVETVQDRCYIQQDPFPWQVPGGVYPLQLTRWPLVNATPVGFTGNTHGNEMIDGIASTAGVLIGMPVLASDGSVPVGTTVTAVATNSVTLSQPASSSEAGLALTAGVQVIQTLSVGETQVLVYGQDFTIDAERGWLIRLNEWTGVSEKWEAEPTTVIYQAGYAEVPPDIEDACLRLVTARNTARGRDPMLMEMTQPNLGTKRYWVGSAPGQVGVLPPEIESLVRPYRVPVAA